MKRLESWLRQPVDNSPLIFFRIAFGFLIFLQAAGSIVLGFVARTFVEPRYVFPIVGFEFVRPLFGPQMYVAFAILTVSAILVMAGAWYRVSLAVFTAVWTVTYVMQTESYNNHYYLMILLCLLLLPTPANAWASIDARRHPPIRSRSCPRWCIVQFVVQTLLVYEFASLAKLQADWLDGRAVASIVGSAPKLGAIGWVYDEPWLHSFLLWGGILFDGLIGPLLLWRRTRLLALALSLFFHLFNSITFRIGIFPYTALALTAFFFPGEQVRRIFFPSKPPLEESPPPPPRSVRTRLGLAALGAFFLLQLYLPLRHHLSPGVSDWTDEGHRMAWRMMLRVKRGEMRLRARHPPSGREWEIDPAARLSPKQLVRVPCSPEMIWQFAQQLKREYAAEGLEGVEIYAEALVSLNGRPPAPLVRSDVDLARVKWNHFGPQSWVTPSPDGSS